MTHSTFLEILWHSSSCLSQHWSLRNVRALWPEGKFFKGEKKHIVNYDYEEGEVNN